MTGSDERLPIGHNLHRSFAIDTMPHDTIEEEVANLRLMLCFVVACNNCCGGYAWTDYGRPSIIAK